MLDLAHICFHVRLSYVDTWRRGVCPNQELRLVVDAVGEVGVERLRFFLRTYV